MRMEETLAKSFGALIRQRRTAESGLTQEALSQRMTDLGNGLMRNKICDVEKGQLSSVGESKIRTLCEALGGTYESFLAVLTLDEDIRGALVNELTACGLDVEKVICEAWEGEASDGSSLDALAGRLIDDMRNARWPGCRCERVIETLTADADERQLAGIERLIGLLLSASVRPIPELDGSTAIAVSDASAGWTLQIGVDGNASRAASVLLDWDRDDSIYPMPTDPVYSVQMPRIDEIPTPRQAAAAGVEAISRALGGVATGSLPDPDGNGEVYATALRERARDVDRKLRVLRPSARHVSMYNTQPCAEHLETLKRDYLTQLRVFDLHAHSGRPMLHCEESGVLQFLRGCFERVRERERVLGVLEEAEIAKRPDEWRYRETNFGGPVAAVYITQQGPLNVLTQRELYPHVPRDAENDATEES